MAAGRQRSQRQLEMKGSTEPGPPRSNIKPRSSRHSLQEDKKISFQFLYQPQNQQGCSDFKTDIPEAPSHWMIWQRSDENDLENQDVNKCHLGPDRQRRYQFSEKILGVKGTGSQAALGGAATLEIWKDDGVLPISRGSHGLESHYG